MAVLLAAGSGLLAIYFMAPKRLVDRESKPPTIPPAGTTPTSLTRAQLAQAARPADDLLQSPPFTIPTPSSMRWTASMMASSLGVVSPGNAPPPGINRKRFRALDAPDMKLPNEW